MSGPPLERAHRLFSEAVDVLAGVVESGADHELLSVITMCEGATRRLDRVTVDAVADDFSGHALLLVAARVGTTRLIDNQAVEVSPDQR